MEGTDASRALSFALDLADENIYRSLVFTPGKAALLHTIKTHFSKRGTWLVAGPYHRVISKDVSVSLGLASLLVRL